MTMPERKDPWKTDRQSRPAGISLQAFVWLALLTASAVAIWKLSEMFPGRLSSDADRAYLLRAIIILALVSAGVVFARRARLSEFLRNVAIWMGIVGMLMLGYAYEDELEVVLGRLQSELLPGYAVSSDAREIVVTANANGQFYVIGEANGVSVRFLVDTGASEVVLAPSDAERMGIDLAVLDFSRVTETANGPGRGAAVTLRTLSVGPIAFSDVPASVNQAEMNASLLGISFLRRLESFQVQGRRLFLRARL